MGTLPAKRDWIAYYSGKMPSWRKLQFLRHAYPVAYAEVSAFPVEQLVAYTHSGPSDLCRDIARLMLRARHPYYAALTEESP